MSDDEAEYEVESIIEARVEAQKRPRKNKLQWKYRVRWRGYTAVDDTWEPIDSFNGSQGVVETFWSKANTNGRDYTNLSLFKAGEQFLPLGPPRKPRKSVAKSSPEAKPPSSTHQRTGSKKRQIEAIEGEAVILPPPKRLREEVSRTTVSRTLKAGPSQKTRTEDIHRHDQTATSSSSPLSSNRNPRRPPSPEIIPDSDEEMNTTPSLGFNYPNPRFLVNKTASTSTGNPPETTKVKSVESSPAAIDFTANVDSLFDDSEPQKTMSHHSHSTQPRVKVDDPNLMSTEGTLSAKARAVATACTSSPTSEVSPHPSLIKRRPKPGPGRSSVGLMKQKNTSSLLTAHKGELKTIKGKFVKEDMRRNKQPEDQIAAPEESAIQDVKSLQTPPPSAEELLQLAGLDTEQAGDLPDFEDHESIQADPHILEREPTKTTEDQAKSAEDEIKASSHKDRVNDALNQLFPVASPTIDSTTGFGSRLPSTIFGLLGSGSDLAKADQSKSSEFFLNLDSSISVPVICHSTAHDPQHSVNVKVGGKGTPGKFYNPKAAIALLDTLRASGSSAILTINEGASAQDTKHFQHFVTRLAAGEIFLAMSGVALLVFCAASNTILAQRLNASPPLLNQHNTILVCQVNIENYSGYADATAGSDNRRWIDYIMTVSGEA